MQEIVRINKDNVLFSLDKHSKWKEHFLAYGCSGAIRCRIEEGMIEEPSEIAKYLTELIKKCTIYK